MQIQTSVSPIPKPLSLLATFRGGRLTDQNLPPFVRQQFYNASVRNKHNATAEPHNGRASGENQRLVCRAGYDLVGIRDVSLIEYMG